MSLPQQSLTPAVPGVGDFIINSLKNSKEATGGAQITSVTTSIQSGTNKVIYTLVTASETVVTLADAITLQSTNNQGQDTWLVEQ
jgi:hypothetical protein